MKTSKRFLTLIMALAMVVSLFAMPGISVAAETSVVTLYENDFSANDTEGMTINGSIEVSDETMKANADATNDNPPYVTVNLDKITNGIVVAEFEYYTSSGNGVGYGDLVSFLDSAGEQVTRVNGKTNAKNGIKIWDGETGYEGTISQQWTGNVTKVKMWANLDKSTWGLYINGAAINLNSKTEWSLMKADATDVSVMKFGSGAFAFKDNYIDNIKIYKNEVALPYENDFSTSDTAGITINGNIGISNGTMNATANNGGNVTVNLDKITNGIVIAEFDFYANNNNGVGYNDLVSFLDSAGEQVTRVYGKNNSKNGIKIWDGETGYEGTFSPGWTNNVTKVKMWANLDKSTWGLYINGAAINLNSKTEWSLMKADATDISALKIGNGAFFYSGYYIDNIKVYKDEVSLPYENDFSINADGFIRSASLSYDSTNGYLKNSSSADVQNAVIYFAPVSTGMLVAEFDYNGTEVSDTNGLGYNTLGKFVSDLGTSAAQVSGQNGQNAVVVSDGSGKRSTTELQNLVENFGSWKNKTHKIQMWADLDAKKWGLSIDGHVVALLDSDRNSSTEWALSSDVTNISSLYIGALRKNCWVDNVKITWTGISMDKSEFKFSTVKPEGDLLLCAVVAYDDDDSIKNIVIRRAGEGAADGSQVTENIPVSEIGNASYYRTFVWKNSSLVPIMAAKKF